MKNLKKIILFVLFSAIAFSVSAQEIHKVERPYNPKANAKLDIQNAVKKAKAQGKHVFIQIGGNWCSWCLMLHRFYTQDSEIDSIMNADYVKVMLNYSKENRNFDILSDFGFPQRFGFPVLVILDANGKELHIQNTAYLEEGHGYNKKKFIEFLKNWNTAALDPKNYKR